MSFIDNLVASFRPKADVTMDYDDTSKQLRTHNAKFVNQDTIKILDPSSQSFLKDFRDMMDELRKVKVLDRDEYLGIMIKDGGPVGDTHRYYVDIPGYSSGDFNSFADAGKTDEFLAKNEYMAFYPVSDMIDQLEKPSVGTIVRVKPSAQYFSAHISRPFENKYLGIYRGGELLISRESIIGLLAENGGLDFQNGSVTVYDEQGTPRTLEMGDGKTRRVINKSDFFNTEQVIITRSGIDFSFPLKRMIMSSDFGPRTPPDKANGTKGSAWHEGLDLIAKDRTTVYACADGVASVFANSETAGNFITLTHTSKTDKTKDGKPKRYVTRYIHLERYIIKSGDTVIRGQLIGYSGHTGGVHPHLHWEVRDIDQSWDKSQIEGKPINPEEWYNVSLQLGSQADLNYSEPDPNVAQSVGGVRQSATQPVLASYMPTKIGAAVAKPEENMSSVEGETQTKQAGVVTKSEKAPSSPKGDTLSKPTNRPKLLLIDFATDLSQGVSTYNQRGSSKIKIREDIISDLIKIKNTLNKYNIPLCCERIDIAINNKISLMAKLGLEIKLNPYSVLNTNLLLNDYFIGPDYSSPNGKGYKIKIYGNVKRNITYFEEKYAVKKDLIDVYIQNIVEGKLEIKKILATYIDITQIFKDFGFIHAEPRESFFINGKFDDSNWFTFVKPSKLKENISYKEALEAVYNNNGEAIWNLPNIRWNGERFI
jgi:hypothetical protein